MKTAWNDTEDEALLGLPLLARVLYLQGLRRYMDYQSGIVGVARGISYQSLREVLFVEPMTGRQDAGSPSIKAVRVAIEQLTRAGLIASIGSKERLVFKCLLADAPQSVQKKEGRPRADLGQTYRGTKNDMQDNSITDTQGRPRADPEGAYQGNPLVSGIREEEDNPPYPPSRPVGGQPSAAGFRLPPTIDPGIWEEFEQHRKAIRKPLNAQSRTKNANVLAQLTHEQQQASVDNTIANRYTGLFPPKVNGHAANRNTPGQRFRAAAEASLAEHWDDPDPPGFRRA